MIGPTPAMADSRSSVAVEQAVDAAELLGQQVGDGLADVGNGQPGQQPGQAALLAGLDAVQQVLARLFAHAFQLQQLFELQVIQVRHAVHQARRRRVG